MLAVYDGCGMGKSGDDRVDGSEACQLEKCDHQNCPELLGGGGGVRCWGTAALIRPCCSAGKQSLATSKLYA